MKIIAFAAAAVVIAAGSAFAGSDHFNPGSVLSSTSGLDGSHTGSVHKKTTKTMVTSPAQGSALGSETKTTSPYNPADDHGRASGGAELFEATGRCTPKGWHRPSRIRR